MKDEKIENVPIKYHYAHIPPIGFNREFSTIEIINPAEGVIKVYRDSQQVLINFRPHTKVSPKTLIEVDEYSGIAAIDVTSKYSGINQYFYDPAIGFASHNPSNSSYPHIPREIGEYGFIIEYPTRLQKLFLKGLAVVENLHKGIIKLYTSSFDKTGYVDTLSPNMILRITEQVDNIKFAIDVSPVLHLPLPPSQDDAKAKLAKITADILELNDKFHNVMKEFAEFTQTLSIDSSHNSSSEIIGGATELHDNSV